MIKLNLTNIKPFARLGIILAILAALALIFVVVNSLKKAREGQPPPVTAKPSLPPLTGAKLPHFPGFEAELAKIKPILPYTGPNYTIRYRQTLNIITIEIDAKSRDEYIQIRQTVEAFLKSKGVTNLCTLNIFWRTPADPLVRESLDAKDIITTDCPVAPKGKP